MLLSIDEVPNLTTWQRQRVLEHGLKTIGDLLSLSDPGTELRKIHRVGNRRAQIILEHVEAYVDEFLS
jgi:ERCC4-type nuclease